MNRIDCDPLFVRHTLSGMAAAAAARSPAPPVSTVPPVPGSAAFLSALADACTRQEHCCALFTDHLVETIDRTRDILQEAETLDSDMSARFDGWC